MNKITNCPNCGAVLESHKCSYCGTIIYDFANFEIGKIAYIRMKIGDTLNVFRARLTNLNVSQDCDTYYADDKPYMSIKNAPIIEMELQMVSDDNGVLLERYAERYAKGETK